ncbi:YkgJ family cysteine cluster protein [Hydrogenovibrio halophilus]|uniref:YkgJ family cysteine cluster protein n=1 Tax=Hydrogenovibrio halophilus TaxID=373391 RepID=UPI000A07B5FC
MNFPCTYCGQCCKHISHIKELSSFDIGNGVCKHLTEENLCAIYEERPEVCQTDVMYKKYYAKQMSESEFLQLNAKACNSMQHQVNLPENFRVNLGFPSVHKC